MSDYVRLTLNARELADLVLGIQSHSRSVSNTKQVMEKRPINVFLNLTESIEYSRASLSLSLSFFLSIPEN